MANAPEYKQFFTSMANRVNSLIHEYSLAQLITRDPTSVTDDNYLEYPTKLSHVSLSIAFKSADRCEHLPWRSQVELVIDRPKCPIWNDSVFASLKRRRPSFDAAFSGNTVWQDRHADWNCSSVNRRLIATAHPLHLKQCQRSEEVDALATWIMTSFLSMYLLMNEFVPGAIEAADKKSAIAPKSDQSRSRPAPLFPPPAMAASSIVPVERTALRPARSPRV